jgi:hypothetical protein
MSWANDHTTMNFGTVLRAWDPVKIAVLCKCLVFRFSLQCLLVFSLQHPSEVSCLDYDRVFHCGRLASIHRQGQCEPQEFSQRIISRLNNLGCKKAITVFHSRQVTPECISAVTPSLIHIVGHLDMPGSDDSDILLLHPMLFQPGLHISRCYTAVSHGRPRDARFPCPTPF